MSVQPSSRPQSVQSTSTRLEQIRQDLLSHHPKLVKSLDSLWGHQACVNFLQRQLRAGRDPEDSAGQPYSGEVMAHLQVLLDLHPSAASAEHRPFGATRDKPPADVFVERRRFPRPLAPGQIKVEEKDTASAWAKFEELDRNFQAPSPPKSERYVVAPEYPVDAAGNSLAAGHASAVKRVSQHGQELSSAQVQARLQRALELLQVDHAGLAQRIRQGWGQAGSLNYLKDLVLDRCDRVNEPHQKLSNKVLVVVVELISLHPVH
jgi:hypothetical protein